MRRILSSQKYLLLTAISLIIFFTLPAGLLWAATPNPPSSLTATALSYSRIELTWTDNSSDELFFYIERKTGASGTYSYLAFAGADVTTYIDASVSPNTEYYYRVAAIEGEYYPQDWSEASASTPIMSLTAPSNLTATALSSSQIELTWTDNSSDETLFYIERKTSSFGRYVIVASVEANVTTYTDTSVSPNTEYFYRVCAYVEGGYSEYSNEAGAIALGLSSPSNLTATAVSHSKINLTWIDTVLSETNFYIERKTGATGTYSYLTAVEANTTTYTDHSLAPNTEYYYRIRTFGAGGYSPYSNEAGAKTLSFNSPSNLTAAAISYSKIKLTWTDNSAEETSFSIERKRGISGTYYYLASVSANATTYTDSTLEPNTEYYYRVSAYADGGNSLYSNEAGATTPALPLFAPSGLTATALPSCEIKLTWADNSLNEMNFYIERKTGAFGSYSVIASVWANVTTYTDFSVSDNTQYFYRVRAYNGEYSEYSNEANATTPIMSLWAPSNLMATALSSSQIRLTWTDTTAEEKSFHIERKKGASGTYSIMPYYIGANTTAYTDNYLLEPNTEYYYRVRSYGDGGYSPYSNGAGTTTLPLNDPSNLTATALSSSQIRLTWTDNSSDETRFYIERKTGTYGTYYHLTYVAANTTTCTDTTALHNTEYFYRVRAFNGGAYSEYSNQAGATTPLLILNAPSNLTATALSSYQVKLSWTDNSSDETDYYIERKKGASGTYYYLTYISANTTTYTDTSALHNTEYYYRVRAYGNGAYSQYSNEAGATTQILSAPSNLTATALSGAQIKLTWTDNSSDETLFYIVRKTGVAGSYSTLTYVGTNTTTYTDTSALQNTEYYYRVWAYNNGGYSLYSNEVSATATPLTINAPSNLTATALSHWQIKLTWSDNSTEEAYFFIERKSGATGTYYDLKDVAANTTTLTDYDNLYSNTEYYYRIRAYGNGAYSAYSNEVRATTLPFNAPSDLTVVPISCSEIRLTWTDNSTTEAYFHIEYKIEGETYYKYLTYVTANTTTYSHTGLVPGKKYYYRVKAYRNPNYSAYSNEASATTILPVGYELASKKIALVPNAGGRYNYGGSLPTALNCYVPDFVDLSVEAIRDNATDPLVAGGYDTVVLVGICDINNFLSNNQFKSRIENFVSNGGKLIIWDSECRSTDYSKFIYPFITSNPGQMGSTGTLSDLEENTLSSKNILSDNYINVSYISNQTTAVGDANVLITQDPNWCIDMTAENYNGVTGPVHTYAQYGKGLIIYDGFDKTDLNAGQAVGTADGIQNLAKIWMLELKQAWNPVPNDPATGNSGLPCLIPVVGIQLSPESATVPISKYHTILAKIVDQAGNPGSGVTVTFTVKSGPHTGIGGTGITDSAGIATFSYKGMRAGVDSIEASATVNGSSVISKTVNNEWIIALTDVRVIDTISNANITADELSISPTPYSISQAGDVVEIEWRYSHISIGEIQDLSFHVNLLHPIPGEDRLVNRKLVIYYTDVDGNPVMAELGPQYVHVLNSALEGSISTDKPGYQPNENVEIGASIKSHSEYAQTIDAKIVVEDSKGALVKEVALLQALEFSPGETKFLADLAFNIGLIYAGNYRARLILYDNQKTTAEAFTDLAILPAKVATTSVTTDKVTYTANEAVRITSQIRSESPNYIFRDLKAKISLFDNQGQLLFVDSKTIPVITPGGLTTFESLWNTAINTKGKYTVKLELFEDISVLGVSQATFDILGTSQTGAGLAGTITAQPNPVNQGNSETLKYSVWNTGNEDIHNLAIKVLVVDPDTQEIRQTFESTVNLNMAATSSGQFVVSTTNMQFKTYVVLLQYVHQGITHTAAACTFVVKDGIAPIVSILSPASGGTYTSSINIEVKATDDSSGIESVEYRLDSGSWRLLPVADLLAGRYMTAWTLSQTDEGTHTISFRATDRAGNKGFAGPVSFIVKLDNIPPETRLSAGMPKHEANGRMFVTGNTSFTLAATDNHSGVAKTEYRIDGGAWTPYAPFTISVEGAHDIYYRSSDNAGNTEPAKTLSVIVDNTPPSVNAGVDIVVHADRNGTRTLTIDAAVTEPEGFDRNPIITWTVNGLIIGNSEDLTHTFGIGRHDLTLKAVDHLDNIATDTVTVTVLERRARLTYTGDVEGQWSDTAVFSVHVSDITATPALDSLGEYGSLNFSILKDGSEEYRYSVGATDSEGSASTIHHFVNPDMPEGDYIVVVSFADSSGIFSPAAVEIPFRLNAEAGALEYSGNQIATAKDAGIQLQATLYQEEDEVSGSLIDFDNSTNPVWVQFDLYKFNQIPGKDVPYYSPAPVQVRKSLLHPSVGVATIFVPFSTIGAAEEHYTVTMSLLNSAYIEAYPAESLLTVYNPNGRFFTGGGFILDQASGSHNNFGFTFKYNKQGKPQGNLVYILRNEEDGTKARIKSNMLTSAGFLHGNPAGTPTAMAEGRCNVAVYDLLSDEYLGGAGNLNFSLTVEDKGTSGIDQDTFYLRVTYPDGVRYEPAYMKNSSILKGGNIVIHDRAQK